MNDSRSIFGLFIFIGILLFSLWLGVSIVTDQLETLMYVFGGTILLICALLGRRIWLIIPLASAINLTLVIPGQPTTLLCAQILFIAFCALQFLIRRLHIKFQITELEIWIFIITIIVLQVYILNPVGISLFGASTVGGKPYYIYGITLLSCLLLALLRVTASDLRWFLRLYIVGGLINFMMSAVGYFVPRFGVWFGAVEISSLSSTIQQEGTYGVNQASRIRFLGTFGRNIALWISCYKSPIRACFHPLWAPLVLLSLAFAGLSGFRNEIGAIGLTYLVGIAYRGGISSVFLSTMVLVIGIFLIAIINLATPLHANIQRSLSFLPGSWDQEYVKDAEGSTEWRVDIWKEALLTDHWIKNKWLGDGLGMSKAEHDFIKSFGSNQTQARGMSRYGNISLQQELMMATGNYHSGPVSVIRTVGYVGLIIIIAAQLRLAVHAHRQIKRAKNTEWFPLTLLIGIPIIWYPFFFVFIIGDFGQAISAYLLGAAFIRILENNLPLPVYLKRGIDTRATNSSPATS